MVSFYSAIVKFIVSLGLCLSKPQLNHLVSMMHGIILSEGRKTISQIRNHSGKDRDLSCMTRFLKESPWCANRVQRRRMNHLMSTIRRARIKRGDERHIIFLIIDDSGCHKNRSTKTMEALDFHFSHTEGKSVWSHCLVTAHVVAEGYSFAWDFRPYFRKSYCEESGHPFKSKNELAWEMVHAFPAADDEQVYVLMDSWYTSKKLVDACNSKGFHVIGAVKSNRKICPAGIQIPMSEFGNRYIQNTDLHSVTVKDKGRFRVYSYEGSISDIKNAKVLLSWDKKFNPDKTPFCILCTDTALDVVTILEYYHVRWEIETGYRYFKELLGFDQYQMLSFKAIERYWVIQYLTQNFLEVQRSEWSKGSPLSLGDTVRRIRSEMLGQLVVYVYQEGLANTPLKQVLRTLKLIA
ncbi:IS701 family transposase [Peribacillus saganii]|nr:IS701 family transposase [Peribacillus saganii]